MRARGVLNALLATACAIAVPAAAQQAGPELPLGASEPVPDGKVDTLQEALARAYQTNPTLLAARANLRATDENIPIDRADELPNASLQTTYTEYLLQAASSFTAPTRSAAGTVNLTVPLYAGGARRNTLRGAEIRDVAGRADLRGLEVHGRTWLVGAIVADDATPAAASRLLGSIRSYGYHWV